MDIIKLKILLKKRDLNEIEKMSVLSQDQMHGMAEGWHSKIIYSHRKNAMIH